ncbi:MAG: tRNA pseudouridine(55) synthase TruB [Lachnospiraceae bacterium]|nr:tRNA pseudouridine(55) synthase TruB [Lachnospiraceae bacterium]
MINGIINVYKEKDFTSHDVVAKLRGIVKQKKIGHTGTLDPDATGVLPVCLGNATKLCDMLTDKSKEYVTTMRLGFCTDTQDISGEVLKKQEVNVTKEDVTEAVMSFVGKYDQIPPMYSALKVNGKKLYELAREGIEIERKARSIEIFAIEILDINLPDITMKVHCSKGTYIRTLCHDIGLKLGCFATMVSLKRTKVANFLLENAYTLSQIEACVKDEKLQDILTKTEDMFELLSVRVAPPYEKLLFNGNPIYLNQIMERIRIGDKEQVKLYAGDRFCAVYECDEEKNILKPVKMFLE